MADLFISYKREDIDRVRPFIDLLEHSGFSVWWDYRIESGDDWLETILREVRIARGVVAFWSRNSIDTRGVIRSRFIQKEHEEAREKLIPLMLDPGSIPFTFSDYQAADFVDWDGSGNDARWVRLVKIIESRCTPPWALRAQSALSGKLKVLQADKESLEHEVQEIYEALKRRGSPRGPNESIKSADADLPDKNEFEIQRLLDERQLLVQRLEQALAEAEKASHAKSAFLANMSHELRTPLNAINGFSEIMAAELFGPLGSPQYVGYAKDILNNGSLLLSLINDILDMAKIEAGKQILNPVILNPQRELEEACRLFRPLAEQRSIKLVIQTQSLPDFEVDARALKQILNNLLSNAIKFTPENGLVTIRGVVKEEMIAIEVQDTGIGIPKNDIPRLARPFEQVESAHSRQTAGTGLGLALTKSLLEAHGGKLQIESELGVGTIVRAILPLRQSKLL